MNKKQILICIFFLLVLTLVSGFIIKPKFDFSFLKTSQSILNPNQSLGTIDSGENSFSQYRTTGNYYYKLLPRTGNESLYSVSFRDINKIETIICLEADFDEKEIIAYKDEEQKEIDKSYNYSVPSTLSFYKTTELSKQADLEKELIKASGISSSFEEGDINKFCYTANKEKDFYLKFGDDSVIVILEAEVVSDSLLTNVTAETGKSNFTHLNISTTAPYDSLVGYWSFDGDKEDTLLTTAYDFSGYGNDGAYVNQSNASSVNCLTNYGECLQVDGDGDYVDLPDTIDDFIDTTDFTMMVWIYPKFDLDALADASANDKALITKYSVVSNPGGFLFKMDTGNDQLQFASWNNSVDLVVNVFGTKTSWNANQWYHVSVVYNSTGYEFFVDGSSDGYTSDSDRFGTTTIDVNIGRANAAISQCFNGTMDEVMIFNTSLTASQISDIYNNQSARFVGTGKQELNDQTYLNISSGNNKVNVTTVFDNNFNSNVSLFLQYYNTTGWFSTSAQNLTSGANSTFTINSVSTNLTLNYTLIAGNDSITTFYTPIVYDDIILDVYSEVVDTEYPQFSTYWDDNASLEDTGTGNFNVTVTHTNGTVILHINGTDIVASNSTADVYNATHTFTEGGTYLYNWTAYGNGTEHNLNTSTNQYYTVNITVDTTPPNVTINSPLNTSYNTPLNFTVTALDETLVEECWLSTNLGVSNVTMINESADVWNYSAPAVYSDKGYHIQFWCNDTGGYVNNTETVDLLIDTIEPNVTINTPLNTTYNTNSIDFNITIQEVNIMDSCWISIDSGVTNLTLLNTTNNDDFNATNTSVSDGSYHTQIWCNDTTNNINNTETKDFRVDATYPEITITNPTNNSNLSSATFDLNYTYVETNPDSCWYSNNSGVGNSSIVSMGTNWTDLTGSEGSNNRTIYCNDSANNLNSSLVYFTIDTIYPTLNITYPINNTDYTDTTLDVNYTYVEINCDSIWYSNDSMSANTTLANCGTNITTITWTIGIHNVTIWINDSANNVNSSYVNFSISTLDIINPNVTFNFQDPSDLDSVNGFINGVNISYNISDETSLNTSEIDFYKKINSSDTDTSNIIINGTEEQSGFLTGYTSNSNISDTWYFWLDDNDFYPGTYNLNNTLVDNTVHSIYSLTGLNSHIKTRIFNVSAYKNYSFFEIMANSSGTKSLRFYYCNSSYTNGNNPIVDTSCTNFYNLAPTTTFNHTHSSNSEHQVIPFAINQSGYIGNVFVTSTSYFLARGQSGATWNIYYVPDISREDTIQTTTNKGTDWTNVSGTVDAHLHQYNGTESLWYYVCANDTSQNENCSTARQDLLDYAGLPPSAPDVYNPSQGFYSGSITINYTTTLSPNGYNPTWYNITLVNTTENFNQTIHNNSFNLSYVWDSTSASDGEYLIRVRATDTIGQFSYGFSENITIDNTYPELNITYPINNTDYTDTALDVNYTYTEINCDSVWYSNDSMVSNTTLSCGTNITTITWTIGNHNVTIWINDSANNVNSSYVNFSISVADTTNPEITIVNPVNNSNLSSATFDLNYTFIETNPDSCWYSNNSGTANSSTVVMGTNWSLSGVEGSNNRTVYCNDTTNNLNSTIVYFTIDTTYPQINITTPTNHTNSTDTGLNVNYTATNTNLDSCWYSNDTYTANTTLTNCTTNITTVTWIEGNHNVTIWVNDSSNNVNSSFVTFTIDISPPYFTVIANQTLANTTALNYDIDAEDLYTEVDCFTVNNTDFDITCAGVLTNATTFSADIYYINITVNDSLNNLNSSIMFVNYTFVADTTPPYFVTIANYTNVVNTSFVETIVGDDNVAIDSYVLNDTSVFIINITNGTITNATALTNLTIYYLNVTINDTSSNLNSSVFYINITEIVFNLTVHSPTNTSYDTSQISLVVSTTRVADTHWYFIDNSSNVTFTPNTTLNDLGWEAWHVIQVYANDSSNNVVSRNVRFYVGEYRNKWLYFYISILGVAILLFIIGYNQETYLLTLLSGFLILAFAITFISVGYPSLDNGTMQISIILLSWAIGMYLTLNSSLGLIREGL